MMFRQRQQKGKTKDGPLRKSRGAASPEGIITCLQEGEGKVGKPVSVRNGRGKKDPCMMRRSREECLPLVRAQVMLEERMSNRKQGTQTKIHKLHKDSHRNRAVRGWTG